MAETSEPSASHDAEHQAAAGQESYAIFFTIGFVEREALAIVQKASRKCLID